MREYVHKVRPHNPPAFLTSHFDPGESAQVDWGHYGTVNVGNTRRQLTREGRLWNEFVARYHYLGYKPLVGAQMRYAVHDRNGWPLAMLGFSTAAWKLAPRDRARP